MLRDIILTYHRQHPRAGVQVFEVLVIKRSAVDTGHPRPVTLKSKNK